MTVTTSMRPASMAAVMLNGYGGLDRYAYREDVAVPRPAPGEVLIKVEACSINNTDVNARANWYAEDTTQTRLTFPRIQGADVVGWITEVGSGVHQARLGERVVCDPTLRPQRQREVEGLAATALLGYDVDGGFSEYVAVPAANAWKVPKNLPAVELAAYPVAYSTALEMILRSSARPMETIVVTGASGGVGTALIQLSRVFHLQTIAIASHSKAQRLRELGAHLVIDRHTSSLPDAIRDARVTTVDIVADLVGGGLLPDLLRVIRPGGRYISAGAVGGVMSSLDLRDLIYKDVRMRGVSRPAASTFALLVDLIDDGELRPSIAATYPLKEFVAAQTAFLRREHVGKVVVTIP